MFSWFSQCKKKAEDLTFWEAPLLTELLHSHRGCDLFSERFGQVPSPDLIGMQLTSQDFLQRTCMLLSNQNWNKMNMFDINCKMLIHSRRRTNTTPFSFSHSPTLIKADMQMALDLCLIIEWFLSNIWKECNFVKQTLGQNTE